MSDLSQAERELLLRQWNRTQTPYPRSRTLPQLFEEQVRRTPEAIALVFRDQSLTYAQLNDQAEALAAELRRRGVRPEVPVGVCLLRSPEMVVGLYAIHKAGGAYVPMDPGYPPERLAFMLEDTRAPVLLTHRAVQNLLPPSQAKIVCVDLFPASPLAPSDGERAGVRGSPPLSAENLAYVIYTSGSTGKPKGVMVRHRNVVNFFSGMDAVLGTAPGVWLALTSISFDISVLELFWTLARGFKVVLLEDELARSRRLALQQQPGSEAHYTAADQILRHGVTHLQCTPSLARLMMQDPDTRSALRQVKHLLFGGEALPPDLVQQFQGYGEILNMYGPTETTIWSTCHPVTRAGGSVAIGRPLANTTIYILDQHLQPVPVGEAGELFIGGQGVARGYWHRPELTAERFLSDPFSLAPSDGERAGVRGSFDGGGEARLYRTGDLARYRPDGTIEFLGRLDQQVKLRGFRIEPGEIESALCQFPGVEASAVTVWEVGPNNQQLVGYFVSAAGAAVPPAELKRFLKNKLPEYMVPAVLTSLPRLPLTPNGKIDRRALPLPKNRAADAGGKSEIRNLTSETTGKHQAGEKGRGGPLTPTLSPSDGAREKEPLTPALSPSDGEREEVLPLPAGSSYEKERGRAPMPPAGDKAASHADSVRTVPLTEAQREIWYASQMSDAVSSSFNLSVIATLRGPLDVPRLVRSMSWLVERHEALRVTCSPEGDCQHIHRAMSVDVPLADLSSLPPESRQEELHRCQLAAVNQPFDLSRGPLWRARLIRLAPQEHLFLLTVHHLVCDGSSSSLLLQELGERYSAQSSAAPVAPAPSFSDFVLEQEAARRSPERKATEAFWLELYSRPVPVLELPADRPRPAKRVFTGGCQSLRLRPELTRELKRFSSLQRCSLTTTLLAGCYLLLHFLSRQSEILVGLPTTSRSGERGERLVGHCVNFLPLRLTLERERTVVEHLDRVRQVLLQAQEHHNFTLGSLLQKLKLPRGIGRMPLVSVMFNLEWGCDELQLAGMETAVELNPLGNCRYDLTFNFAERAAQMELQCHYSAELFDADTIQRWLRHYQFLLSAIVTDPGQRLDRICRLPEEEALQLPEASPVAATLRLPSQEEDAGELSPEPLNATEQALARIWCEVIGLEAVGRADDFFDVGGHSLLATQIISRITRTFNVEMPLRSIFEAPTLGALAETVAQAQREQPAGAVTIPRRASEAKSVKLLERLEQLSENELQELLRNPKLKDLLS